VPGVRIPLSPQEPSERNFRRLFHLYIPPYYQSNPSSFTDPSFFSPLLKTFYRFVWDIQIFIVNLQR
ncbi:hypothetical protein KSW92_17230, partial [Prevotella copri]|uniref:hypothetical protein n=1 Tax=Segatella copri TaxID=165179 RepID=UPI001C39231E